MWSPEPPTPEQRDAIERLGASRRPLLVGHERPDPDVLGSQAALAEGLARRGARPSVVNPDPPPHGLSFAAPACGYGWDRGGPLPEHDLVVLLDLSELGRTGALAERLAASPAPKVVVDHHRLPDERFWDALLWDDAAASTSVLVARALAVLGVELDAPIARGVLLALVGDTGFFRFDNTNAEAFELAAACARAGATTAELFRHLRQDRDPRFPGALATLLGGVEYRDDGRVALLVESRAQGLGGLPGLGDTALDVLRSVGRVDVALHLRELEDGGFKLSARAKAPAEVHSLAASLGGGGHARAAGATLAGPLGAARRRLDQALAAAELRPAEVGGGPSR